jgi:hypothetical protein
MNQPSKGHLFNTEAFEYFVVVNENVGDRVYRAPLQNPLNGFGYREGMRFECWGDQIERLRALVAAKAA